MENPGTPESTPESIVARMLADLPPKKCICDGAAYDQNQKFPFLAHPLCPIHGSEAA